MHGPGAVSDKRGAPFWMGLVTGLAVAAVALALAAGWISRRGLVVTVETAALKTRVEEEVRTAVRRELPRALATLQAEVPAQVAAAARRRLTGARMELGGFEVEMPPALVLQVEQAMDQALRAGLEAALRQVDMKRLADRMGNEAAALARSQLEESLAAQPLTVQVVPGFRVPVRIQPQ